MDIDGVQIDPFGYHPDRRSAVRPLGGDIPSLDQKYVFHTNYITCHAGRIIFSIRFEHMRSSHGELCIQLQSYRAGDSRGVLLVNSTRRDLTNIPGEHLELSIETHAVEGVGYALYGYVSDTTDAEARDLLIYLREIEDSLPQSSLPLTADRSARTDVVVDRLSRLVGTTCASFSTPVSQAMTRAQLTEPQFSRSAAEHGMEVHAEAWPTLFAFRAIEIFGLAAPGSRGLCLGEPDDALSELLNRRGCEVVQATTEAITGGFDFAWSIHESIPEDDAWDFAAFVEGGMRHLLPKGLAVHIVPVATLRASFHSRAISPMGVQKAALTLIARGYDVVQLNFEGCDDLAPDEMLPFGLIVQRPAKRG